MLKTNENSSTPSIGIRGVGYDDIVRLLERKCLTPDPNPEKMHRRAGDYLYFYPYTENCKAIGLILPEYEERVLKGDPATLAKKWAKANSEQGEGFLLKLYSSAAMDFRIEPDAWFGKRHFYAFQVSCPQGIGLEYFTEIISVSEEDKKLLDIYRNFS